jgi:hypothetical protein
VITWIDHPVMINENKTAIRTVTWDSDITITIRTNGDDNFFEEHAQ